MIDTGVLSVADVQQASRLFLSPSPQYSWGQIIDGVAVEFPDGHVERRDAVGVTFRGFHKLDKTLPGSKQVFDSFFKSEKERITTTLSRVSNREELDAAQEVWRSEIVAQLINVKPHQIQPYNKTRKPVDLYVMNLVALAKELGEVRHRLVTFLFIPLDSQMFSRLFDENELRQHGLTKKSSYGDLRARSSYVELQEIGNARAETVSLATGEQVHPIYFEMLWRDRLKGAGSNIFLASPMRG